MATGYTSLLGLALPVTGELSGTWGDTVNDYITKFVDAAVAGVQTISGTQTAVTLSKTEGTTLSSAGTGATGSSQYAIINCTGTPASLLTITAPAASKFYILINGTAQSVKIVGAGPTTGVTAVAGEKCIVAWNGSDFVKVASTSTGDVTGPASSTSGNIATFNGTTGKVIQDGGKALPSGSIVGTTDSQTLTNKTLTSPVISTITNTGTLTLPTSTDTLVGRATTDTLTNKTLTTPTITAPTINDGYTEEIYAVIDGASVALSPTNGSIQTWTLGANRTPTAGTWANGQSMTLMVDDGTAYQITWTSIPVTWKTNSGNAPTLNTSGYTVIQLWKVGGTVYGARVGDA